MPVVVYWPYAIHVCVCVHDNEPQLPWLRTAIYHTGLDVKMEVRIPPFNMYVYVYMYMYMLVILVVSKGSAVCQLDCLAPSYSHLHSSLTVVSTFFPMHHVHVHVCDCMCTL